jgi:hypothetical protein
MTHRETMRAKGTTSCDWVPLWRCLATFAFALALAACGSNEYYFVNDITGEGDTIILHFIHTCGDIEVSWNGAFVGAKPRAELTVAHEAPDDCGEDPREVPYDVGPMKRTFRETHPDPEPLGLRIPQYYEEQGAICVSNLFQEAPYKGGICP